MTRKKTNYEIFIFSDQNSMQKQMRISRRTLQWTLGLAGFGLVALISTTIYLFGSVFKNSDANARVEDLAKKNQQLQADNDYLWDTTSEVERRLTEYKEKTEKLAMMVGLQSEESQEGLGGPDVFGSPYDEYNRPDLGFLQKGMVKLEERIKVVQESFSDKIDQLDATPSILPTRGWISSGYSERIDPFTKTRKWHNGIDISCPRGTPVYAPAKGVISQRSYKEDFGNTIEISHENGLMTRFAHLDRFNVSPGQRVKRGDLIGYVGTTGRSTAPHLHYEIHQGEKSVDPIKYVIHD
jgi:murein DD-endopeptidase MepM/ murein hydrolase activator NlpD